MSIIFLRTIILSTIVCFTMRMMGKRQIGELQPFEFVVTIMASEVASIPMQDGSIPLISGIIPLFTLLAFQLLFSYCSTRSLFLRKLICGTPTILIDNGSIQIDNMKREIYSLSDLLEQLRGQGYDDISQIHTAILETNGTLSIIPKSLYKPTTAEMLDDMQTTLLKHKTGDSVKPISNRSEGYAKTIIEHGKINYKNLYKENKDKQWLFKQLKKNNITNIRNIYYAGISTDGRIQIQLYEDLEETK